MKQKILITAALPYANGTLHFGHLAGTYLPADCYARFARLQGHDVLFISGSDEYGVAITLSAEMASRSPQEHVDLYHAQNQNIFKKMAISFDHFSRTTSPSHQQFVEQFFNDLLENGYIEARETLQLYSEGDQKFLADRYVTGICPSCGYSKARGDECGKCGASFEAIDLKEPRSKLTGAPLVLKKTTHWFLLLEKLKDKLEAFLNTKPWKNNVLNFVRPYLQEIRARAITRDLQWGIKVPLPEAVGKVFYVWFDAPIGYITCTHDWGGDWEKYWLDSKTKYVQFMGKDNIPFHALFFPAMVMGQNKPYKLVDDLVANEFYNLEGKQFSKSEGWTIDLDDFFNRFHTDQIRYCIAANAPETADSEFTWKDFEMRCNAELVGKFGNFVNRVLVFLQNNCEGHVPNAGPLQEADQRFINTMHRLSLEIEESYANYKLRKVTTLLMELAHAGNSYFDAKAPWKDAKAGETRIHMNTTISLCLEAIKRLMMFCYPIMPQTATHISEMLGLKGVFDGGSWQKVLETPLEAGKALAKPELLFQKVEESVIEEEIAKLQSRHAEVLDAEKPTTFAPLKEAISIDEFQKLDLRVGVILKAEKVAKSKKLLQLEVDIGIEKRQILSGISLHFTPEELVGKKVIVVANLKPAKLMGIESQGMVLAGAHDSRLELITLEQLPAGAQVS